LYAYPNVAPDNYVGFWDLIAFADHYNGNTDLDVFDLTGDGLIDVEDKTVFCSNWHVGEHVEAECLLSNISSSSAESKNAIDAELSYRISENKTEKDETIIRLLCDSNDGVKYFNANISASSLEYMKIEKGEALNQFSSELFYIVEQSPSEPSSKIVTFAIFGDEEITGSSSELIKIVIKQDPSSISDKLCEIQNIVLAKSSENISKKEDIQVSYNPKEKTPQVSVLYQNYPNPFNPNTTISYYLHKEGHVSLKIYNVKGELIKTLVNGHKTPGRYSVEWNGKSIDKASVCSGIYFYQLNCSGNSFVKKMILLR
jgi:hypothetical protein